MSGDVDASSMTTKDLLLRVLDGMNKLEDKVDKTRESQVRTETILSEGRFGERIMALEKFRDRFEGSMSPVRWALGGSGIALALELARIAGVIHS